MSYHNKIFKPPDKEYTISNLTDIENKLPKNLTGCLYRNGPGKSYLERENNKLSLFDGDGMIAMFKFQQGKVSFKNRYIQTPWFQKEARKNKEIYAKIGSTRFGGVLHQAKGIKNPANTNLIFYGNSLYALYEGGRPVQLDPEELDYMAKGFFHKNLPMFTMFCAHPQIEPDTGVIYNISTSLPINPKPTLTIWKADKNTMSVFKKIKLDNIYMLHSFAMTKNHIILFLPPLHLKLNKLLNNILGKSSLIDCYETDFTQPTTIKVINKHNPDNIQEYTIDPCVHVHVINAFEDESDNSITLDIPLLHRKSFLDLLENITHNSPAEEVPTPYRIRLLKNGKYTKELLTDKTMDFPYINSNCNSQAYRYAYGVNLDQSLFNSDRTIKLDVKTGKHQIYHWGQNKIVGEPIFVPKENAIKEDEGWLFNFVNDLDTDRTFLGILDPANFNKAPTKIFLPFHIPYGFHGIFLKQ